MFYPYFAISTYWRRYFDSSYLFARKFASVTLLILRLFVAEARAHAEKAAEAIFQYIDEGENGWTKMTVDST
jgi:hypothetical protein